MAKKIQPLYAVAMQQATSGGDVEKMRALAEQAEAHLASEGDIPAELKALKAAIAKHEERG